MEFNIMWFLYTFLFAALIISGIILVNFEEYSYGIATMIALFLCVWFINDFPFHSLIAGLTWKVALFKWLPIYLGIGVGVALIKWFFHVWKTANLIKDSTETFKNLVGDKTDEKGNEVDDATRKFNFVKHYMKVYSNVSSPDYVIVHNVLRDRWKEEDIVVELLTPRAKNHVEKITFWVLEWPWVVISTLLDDVLRKFTKQVTRFFDWAFTRASRFWIARSLKGF